MDRNSDSHEHILTWKREGGKETQTERERASVIREKLTLPPFPDRGLQCLACHAPGTCRKPAPSVAQPRHTPCSPCTASLLVQSSYKVQYTYTIHIPDQLVLLNNMYIYIINICQTNRHRQNISKVFFSTVSLGNNKSKKNSNANRCKLIKVINNWLSSTKVILFLVVKMHTLVTACLQNYIHTQTKSQTWLQPYIQTGHNIHWF